MAVTIDIACFEAADRQGVIELILPIQREEFGFAITPEDQPDLHAIAQFYQTGRGDFWVARKEGKVVGTVGLKDIGSSQAALRKMFVAAPFRGPQFAVASRLLARLLSEADNRGITDIFLGTTDRFVAAHRFYEKNGFVEIAAGALPAGFPRMALDTKFYATRLHAARPAGRTTHMAV